MPAIKYLAHLLIAVAALVLAAAATSADAQRVSAGGSGGYASSGEAVPSAMTAAQGGETA